MKVLWIARTCPVPATDGERLRVLNLMRVLARHHQITLVCRRMADDEAAHLPTIEPMCEAVHAVPVPRPSGFGERLRWLAPFVASRYPISLATVFFQPVLEVLRRLTAEHTYDVVLIEHSSLAIYLDHLDLRGAPLKVVTLHNLDTIRNERLIANTPFGLTRAYHQFNQSRFRHYEPGALRQFDHVVAMSEVDRSAVEALVPGLPVTVVPNGVDCTAYRWQAPATRADAPGLLFVGSMDSEANHDGVMHFLDDILPGLQAVSPGVRFTVAGRRPSPALRQRHAPPAVDITGDVPSVEPYYRRSDIAVVPLRSGGGTRLKILEAMALGTPVVSTRVGAEGLDVRHGQHILLADTAREQHDAIVSLLGDPALRHRLSVDARRLVESRYDWQAIGERHHQLLVDAAAHRVAGRTASVAHG